jgi:UrcA family protein
MSRAAGIWINATLSLLAAVWQGNAVAAAPAAVTATDVNRVVVRFADVNLDQPAGVATLYRRINLAADHVCGERYRAGSRFVSTDWRVCVGQAVDRAVLALDRPTLNAYHRAHIMPVYRGTTTVQAFVAKP